MALIRATSNPEGLYIYGGIDEPAVWHISAGGNWAATNCNSAKGEPAMLVPEKTFEAVLEKWWSGEENFEIDGFSLEEGVFYLDDGSRAPSQGFTEWASDPRPRNYMLRWSYDDLFVCVYDTTMAFIVSNWQDDKRRDLVERARMLRRDYDYWNGHGDKEVTAMVHAGASLAREIILTLDPYADPEEL